MTVDLIVASPPYAESETCGNRKELDRYDSGQPRTRAYGTTPGQLGTMKDTMKHTEKASVGEMPSDAWTGCYDGGWQGLIVDEAFAHP